MQCGGYRGYMGPGSLLAACSESQSALSPHSREDAHAAVECAPLNASY